MIDYLVILGGVEDELPVGVAGHEVLRVWAELGVGHRTQVLQRHAGREGAHVQREQMHFIVSPCEGNTLP